MLALLAVWAATAVLAASVASAAAVRLEKRPEPDANARWAELSAELEALRTTPTLGVAADTTRKRVALVVGNNAYRELDPLNKAVGDAGSIATALADLGFEVTALSDVDRNGFDDALEAFYRRIEPGDIAFFFYAGHGVQVGGINYLLPVDMPTIEAGGNPRLDRNAVDATLIVAEVTSRGAEIAFVVLDACRDSPFPQPEVRGAHRIGGLARMTPEQGTFIIYSAGAGQTALDRLSPDDGDPNSVFTRKFMPILTTPGMPIVEIAKRTQVEVKALADKVNHAQAPAYYDQVIGQFWFRRPEPKLYGLVIGIDEYDRVQRLRGAVNDAHLVSDALRDAGAEEVVTVTDRDARLAHLDYVWRSMVDKASPGDTVVFSYAGSSFRAVPGAGSAEADGFDEYLALADADWDALKSTQRVADDDESILRDDTLTAWMELAANKNLNVIMFVDGCYGGGLLDREFANVSFVSASAEDEVAIEKRINGRWHGAMSVAFAEAIRGAGDLNADGYISQRELYALLRAGLFSHVGFRQTPEFMPEVEQAVPSLALFRTAARAQPADITR